MKFNPKSIFLSINIGLIAIALLIIVTSPTSRLSEDQQQLQEELAQNAQMLEQQHDKLTDSNEPTPSDPIQPPVVSSTPIATQQPMVSPSDIPQTSISVETPVPTIDSTPLPVDNQPPAVTAIGDSVMLGTSPKLQEIFPSIYIDATTSRQVWDADEIIEDLKSSNLLGEKVIIALGANGTFRKEVGQEILDLIGLDSHTVYWVLPYGDAIPYQADVVDKVYQLQYDNPSLVVIDWPLIGYDHPEWFYDDNTHLNSDGQIGYAQYLYDCVYGG